MTACTTAPAPLASKQANFYIRKWSSEADLLQIQFAIYVSLTLCQSERVAAAE